MSYRTQATAAQLLAPLLAAALLDSLAKPGQVANPTFLTRPKRSVDHLVDDCLQRLISALAWTDPGCSLDLKSVRPWSCFCFLWDLNELEPLACVTRFSCETCSDCKLTNFEL